MFWLLLIIALFWWASCEIIRSRPSVSGKWSVFLVFVGPIGAISLCVCAFVFK